MRLLLYFLLILGSFYSKAQEESVNSKVTKAYLNTTSEELQKTKRSLMYSDNSRKIGPIKMAFSGLMFLYQNVISEQISASCTYEISCSQYTKLCIERYGLFIGSIKGFHQLMHCTTNAIEEVPDYMKSNHSVKIKNSVN